jgi:hypothetical protein
MDFVDQKPFSGPEELFVGVVTLAKTDGGDGSPGSSI